MILANDTVIFQTTRRLVCYDFSALTASSICDSPPQPPATAAWVYPDTSDFVSICASPVLASSREVSGVDLIFAHGNDGLLALTPSGTLVDFEAMLSCDSGFTTPAIGPIHDDDPEAPDDRNLAYVSLFDLGNPSCQAGDPKMFGFVADDFATNVAVSINDGPQLFRIGSGASPTLRDDGVCVIPSDDGWVYAIENTTTMARIWRIRPPGIIAGDSYSFSASAAVFPDGNLICWDEYSTVSLINSEGVVWGSRVLSASTWIGGSSAADRLRWYNPHAWRAVRCYANDVEFDEELLPPYPFKRVWGYLPPEPLRVPLVGAPAIDGDGTLIFQSGSHILALRPLLADFNGDGCRNNFDGDSLAQLLTSPAQWQTEIGDVLGINGLGVCDCNNDGVCNNFDIDCAVDLILYGPTQCGEPAFTPDDGEPKDEEESSQFSGSGGFGEAESMEQAAAEPSTSSSPAEAYLEEFLAIIAGLRTYFEME
ncbi:MAG: hypothetical protein HRU75_14635 [Planctomycetia bacterium]|nr:MAG: hypothetical protein HRU75_14635 [Planctomycetia bacterium]